MHVIEIVTFRRHASVTAETLAKHAEAANAAIARMPGFIARRLSLSEDGIYTEHVEWSDMASAKAAAAAIMSEPAAGPFMQAIDPQGIQMKHNMLVIRLN
jgi:hypothetical protein